jgi:Domain of unknown function (DUF5911)
MALDGRADRVGQVVLAGARRDRYLPIAEHGLIGDLHTAALVGTDGTIDWYCCARFDSPSIFAAILDAEHEGLFRIAPDGDDRGSGPSAEGRLTASAMSASEVSMAATCARGSSSGARHAR